MIVVTEQLAQTIRTIHPELFTSAERVAWLQQEYDKLAKRHVELLYRSSHLQWQVLQLARDSGGR